MNPKRYWLRGGGIASLLPILFVLTLVMGILLEGEWGHCGDMGCQGFGLVAFFLILGVPPFFLVGSILGFIYGKFKK